MSAARDLFLSVPPFEKSETAFNSLSKAAELWRISGLRFSAGMAMLRACDAAWGNPQLMQNAISSAIEDFSAAAESETRAVQRLVALKKYRQGIQKLKQYFEIDLAEASLEQQKVDSEIAETLIREFSNSSERDNYLVRGYVVTTDLDDKWDIGFPEVEVDLQIEQFGGALTLNMPSAFHCLIARKEWARAIDITADCESAFNSPGQRGWRSVALAQTDKNNSEQHFKDAAENFALDTPPPMEAFRSWSSVNIDLWAPYCRARASLAEAITRPEKAMELLASANEELRATRSGWHNDDVSRLSTLLEAILGFISSPHDVDVAKTLRDYKRDISRMGIPGDAGHAVEFITLAAESFRGFSTDPEAEITRGRIQQALTSLARIESIGPELASAIQPKFGRSAISLAKAPSRIWIHSALESITEEAHLRWILLKLCQANNPLYAQILHGPIEYGKDVVVLLKGEKEIVARYYQAKVGEINKSKWAESKEELEELFQVTLNSMQFPEVPNRVEGILVTNGHANSYAEPAIRAWMDDARQNRGWNVEFMHFDMLVNWIIGEHLENEFRQVFDETVLMASTKSKAQRSPSSRRKST